MFAQVGLMRFVQGKQADLPLEPALPVLERHRMTRLNNSILRAHFLDGSQLEFSTEGPADAAERRYWNFYVQQKTRAVAQFMFEVAQATDGVMLVGGVLENQFYPATVITRPEQKPHLRSDLAEAVVIDCDTAEELFRLISTDLCGLKAYRNFFERKARFANVRGRYGEDLLARGLEPQSFWYELMDAIEWRHRPTPDTDTETIRRSLSTGEQALGLVEDFSSEVHNGGFHQYFLNTNCRDAYAALRALTRLGFTEAAEFLRRAIVIAQVPDPLPSDYEFDAEGVDPEDLLHRLDNLDTEFYAASTTRDWATLFMEYVRQHPDEFA